MSDVKFENLSMRKDSVAARYLYELSEEEYVERVTMLPDLHWKDKMLVPSSIVIKTRDVFVPQFTSVGINCGMTFIDTGISWYRTRIDDLQSIFGKMNKYAFAGKSHGYLGKIETLADICKNGIHGLAEAYEAGRSVLEHFENFGQVDVGLEDEQVIKSFPKILLKSGWGQKETGFDFNGNHFMEFQVIDEIFDEEWARKLKLNPDNLYCFIHTGPDSFVGNLLRFYTYDSDMKLLSRMLIYMAKLVFHAGHVRKDWAAIFKRGINPVSWETEAGRKLFEVYKMCMNYGYAYRFSTFKNLKDHLTSHCMKDVETRIIWDVGHNSIQCACENGRRVFYHRHNSSALIPEKPAIIAGYNNVNSLLGIGLETKDELNSYDHGFGSLIAAERDSIRVWDDSRYTHRIVFKKGSETKIRSSEMVNHYDTNVMKRGFKVYEDRNAIKLVASLRPIANFKN